MKRLFIPPKNWLLVLAACFFVSCDSARREAENLLEKRGVEVTEEALLRALSEGEVKVAEALLTLEVDPSATNDRGQTALMVAAGGLGSSVIPQLISVGAEVETLDQEGNNALSYAVSGGNLEAVVRLLEGQAAPSHRLPDGSRLVSNALTEGKIATAWLLLEGGASPLSQNGDGESLPTIATRKNQPKMLAEIQRRGVKLASEMGEGDGLLHLAIEKEADEAFSYLLRQGLDVDQRNGKAEGVLHRVYQKGRHDLFGLLIEHGVDLGAVDSQGWPLLHLAVRDERGRLVEQLIKAGADVNQVSKDAGDAVSALTIALRQDNFGLAELLLKSGAEAGDEMYRATYRESELGFQIVELLLKYEADPMPERLHSPDRSLFLAVRTGQVEIARALISAGASIEGMGPSGQKPFHVAIARGDHEMIDLLADSGANLDEPFQNEVTEEFLELVKSDGIAKWALKRSSEIYPVMVAIDSGDVPLVQNLIARGINHTKSTRVGRHRFWPLTFATRRADTDMIQVVLGRSPGRSETWMKVDLSEQRAYVYKDDEVVYRTRISSGKKGHRTPKGEFVITNKYRKWTSTLYDSKMPYFQRLSSSDFGFHVGHCPGYAASHGCIRMPHSAAKKLFGMTRVGDYVKIVP